MKLEEDLEGLLHISELTDDREAKPEDILQPGQKVEVRVIRVDIDERKIGLSFVHSDFEENENLAPVVVDRGVPDEEVPDDDEIDSGDPAQPVDA